MEKTLELQALNLSAKFYRLAIACEHLGIENSVILFRDENNQLLKAVYDGVITSNVNLADKENLHKKIMYYMSIHHFILYSAAVKAEVYKMTDNSLELKNIYNVDF